MNLYEIRDNALKSGRGVFSVQQLANLTSSSKAIAKVYAARLVAKGLAQRIIRGKIAFTNDERVIAAQVVEPSYISLESALLIHGLIQQIPKYIECVTPTTSRKIPSAGISYHRIPPALLFGYERVKSGNDYYFLALPEKALIDGAYLRAYSKGLMQELMKKINNKKLKELLKQIPASQRKRIEGELL